ncbi:hypothetical protein F5050DRAFT_1578617 [Lentinula boryana]|uniref:S-adenosyl-L-methionine-dependent methyltransferase n=1 Tax=Lentinula boryana TaxID=40481 RepID=A0ABQ8Q2R8_9AGAR|nr:hypothetical protein F5050DRAFT_1578617 [Lentinula boryana]
MNEPEQPSERYYASTQYLLPADEAETKRLIWNGTRLSNTPVIELTATTRRLNKQHAIIVRAFEGRLSLAPISLKTGDRVLESAAGSGIWALEFFEFNRTNGITVDMECIDISSKQFPAMRPPEMRFSIGTITQLPSEWTDRFHYIHQRLLVAAMNDSLWRSAILELIRVIRPGGWVELFEIEMETLGWGIGPRSKQLCTLIQNMNAEKGVIGDLSFYLPASLKGAGFSDVRCVTRHVSIGGELGYDGKEYGEASDNEDNRKKGYSSEEWRDIWMGMKGPVIRGGGYGIVNSEEEYQALLEDSLLEWKISREAYTTFYTILARKSR